MILKFYIFTLFVLINGFGYCQINEDSFLIWSPHYNLKIEDFRGNITALSKYGDIGSACGYNSYFDIYKNRTEIFVFNTFAKYESPKKYDSFASYVINHEQGHFDLYEVYVRKLRALVIKKYKKGISPNLFTELTFKYQEIADKTNDFYDKETRHGENRKKQAEWDRKIAKWLKDLDKYADPKIVIHEKNKL